MADKIIFNDRLRLIFSDVDETIADVYSPAASEIINELTSLLQEDRKLFLVTGGSLTRVMRDITDRINPIVRRNILVSHCSGAEVWGFTETGSLNSEPFYSVYEKTFTPAMKQAWRDVIAQVIAEFGLRTYPAQPKIEFWNTIGHDPLDIMLDDRGPQITMEVVNGIDLTDSHLERLDFPVPLTYGKRDLRASIKDRAVELLADAGVPIVPHFGGNFALDFAIEGVSKTTSIRSILSDTDALATVGLTPDDIQDSTRMEVWGDKFGVSGGTDRYMSEAVPPDVRSIDFRDEDPAEFPRGCTIVLWDGKYRLHHGLLEYLQSRHS